MNIKTLFVDIDATITDFLKPFPDDFFVGRQPMFSIFRDLMVEEKGWAKDDAEKAIIDYADTVIWWDYPDFIAEFDLPLQMCWKRLISRHSEYLSVYKDTVRTIKELQNSDIKLYIVSNNPYAGCLLKLHRAELGEITGTTYFEGILGANLLRGQKSQPELWRRAIAHAACEPGSIATLGDHPVEDAEIPLRCSIGHAFILRRDLSESIRHDEHNTSVNSAEYVLDIIQ